MQTLDITLPDGVKQFVDEQVSRRDYGSPSDYVAHLIQSDQEERAIDALETEVLKGIRSGPSTPMTSDDWREIREEVERLHAARQQS